VEQERADHHHAAPAEETRDRPVAFKEAAGRLGAEDAVAMGTGQDA
jgi:hypothetical protein